ncbi:amino acid ABC transporter permease [Uliginosibacterium gangwonense]|uniref:amino acid ABC transporter permease n=1 Tax=Uliginosibacterium gangwonense TaxID=392736 RepID=UPI0003646628|nr:amino acid ABC transporter permease [Uliginosibacterium gangwonense]
MNPQSIFGDLLQTQYQIWLLKGFLVTLEVTVLVIPAASFLGFLTAIARNSRWRALAWGTASLVSLLRNSPLLVQLFFWYFGASAVLPDGVRDWLNDTHVAVLFGVPIEWPSYEFVCGVFGLVLYSAAYVSEEIRAGMRGVPKSQRYAAQALGLRPVQVFRYVILPQAFRISLPTLMGQYMNIVKNSSLTMAIGVMEISYASRQVESVTFKTFQAFGMATLFYIMIIAVIEVLAQFLQRHFPVAGARR